MRRNCLVPFLSALVFVLLLAGCWNPFKPPEEPDPGNPPPVELLPRTTPQNVLYNLRVIYGTKDNSVNTPDDAHSLALTYREILYPGFKFHFLAADKPPELPEDWWGRNDEVASFDSLVTKRALGIVNEIQLSWSPGVAQEDNRLDEYGALLHPGWMRIDVTSILLDVVQGETTYRVSNGTANLWFAPDPADTTLWVISEWQDWQPL
ncbi:MAG: hypothetical protein NTX17_08340 [Candidatus Eisenbacteria bacterium]|nr:hypothetical protein [Candidatus Eisenbacteria bacterium]